MTREEALDWLARVKSNTVNHSLEMPLWWNKPLAEALDMAIKALEQDPKSEWEQDHEILKAYSDGANGVIDKIRAEIVDLGQRTMNDNRASGIWACRDIIDKYKGESEGIRNGF